MSNQDAPTLEIEYRLLGRGGKTAFSCWYGDIAHHSTIDLSAARHAERVNEFVQAICTKLPAGIARENVEQLMEKRVGEAYTELVSGPEDGEYSATQATQLVKIAEQAYLFRTPGADPEAYATVTEAGSRKSWLVRSMGFRRWLVGKFYRQAEKAPGAQALQDAVNTIIAQAIIGENEHDVHVRLAARSDEIWLDLADRDGNAIRITAEGWLLVPGEKVPVPFIRRRGMLPLPPPVPGGTIDELRQFVNVEDDDWCLVLAWLAGSFRPGYPYPILNLTGEHGSAKSTAAKVLRELVDPHKVMLRSPPRDERDLFIAANNSWILSLNNLSFLSDWLSDALCRLATGGGFSTRELFSNDEEQFFDVMRPIILNGIADVVTRSDLADRSMTLCLPRIEVTSRVSEELLWSRFYACRPRILGALLDAISAALRNLPSVEVMSLPRMADFARWAVAAESALGLNQGSFLKTYRRNRAAAHELAVETASVGPTLVELVQASPCDWQGTCGELLDDLEKRADERTKARKDWPKTPRGMSGQLRRLAPDLRQIGIAVTFLETGREIVLSRNPSTGRQQPPSEQSAPADTEGTDGRRCSNGWMSHCSSSAENGISAEHAASDEDTPEVRL